MYNSITPEQRIKRRVISVGLRATGGNACLIQYSSSLKTFLHRSCWEVAINDSRYVQMIELSILSHQA